MKKMVDNLEINSIYNFEKISTLFKNLETISFVNLISNYKELLNNGYNKSFLNQNLHTMLSMPFFIFNDGFSFNIYNEYIKTI